MDNDQKSLNFKKQVSFEYVLEALATEGVRLSESSQKAVFKAALDRSREQRKRSRAQYECDLTLLSPTEVNECAPFGKFKYRTLKDIAADSPWYLVWFQKQKEIRDNGSAEEFMAALDKVKFNVVKE